MPNMLGDSRIVKATYRRCPDSIVGRIHGLWSFGSLHKFEVIFQERGSRIAVSVTQVCRHFETMVDRW
jgi:hypothetical protein